MGTTKCYQGGLGNPPGWIWIPPGGIWAAPGGSLKSWILLLSHSHLSHTDWKNQDTLERGDTLMCNLREQGQGTGTRQGTEEGPRLLVSLSQYPLTCSRAAQVSLGPHSCVSMLSSSSPAAGSSWFSSSSSPSFFSGGFS